MSLNIDHILALLYACVLCHNTSRPAKNGYILQATFSTGFLSFCILIKISRRFFREGSINNKSILIQVMAWRWTGKLPVQRQAITWINVDLLWGNVIWTNYYNPVHWCCKSTLGLNESSRPKSTVVNENFLKIHTFSFKIIFSILSTTILWLDISVEAQVQSCQLSILGVILNLLREKTSTLLCAFWSIQLSVYYAYIKPRDILLMPMHFPAICM